MLKYLLKRLLATIPVMGVVALFVFSLLYLSPGDPAAVIAGDIATEEDIARIRAQLGLDQPYLVRFGGWLWDLQQGQGLPDGDPRHAESGAQAPFRGQTCARCITPRQDALPQLLGHVAVLGPAHGNGS